LAPAWTGAPLLVIVGRQRHRVLFTCKIG
jgi:hypothetical protein